MLRARVQRREYLYSTFKNTGSACGSGCGSIPRDPHDWIQDTDTRRVNTRGQSQSQILMLGL